MKKLWSLGTRLWLASIFNVLALISGLWSIWLAQNVKGQSPIMYGMFLFIQLTFAEAGFEKKLWGQFWGMAASAVITITILILILAWR